MLEIDIGKETAAQKEQWQLGTGNFTQFAAQQQTTPEALVAAKKADIVRAITAAAELNTAHPGAGLTWRDIIDAGGRTEKAAQTTAAAKEGRVQE